MYFCINCGNALQQQPPPPPSSFDQPPPPYGKPAPPPGMDIGARIADYPGVYHATLEHLRVRADGAALRAALEQPA